MSICNKYDWRTKNKGMSKEVAALLSTDVDITCAVV